MSVRHIGLVLDHLEAPPGVKLVAMILADHADADGVCWPSYRRVAERSCLGERTVRRYIAELIDMGVVTKLDTGHGPARGDGAASWTSNRYRIEAAALAAAPSLLRPPDEHAVEAGASDGVVGVCDHHPGGGGGSTHPPGGGSTRPGVVGLDGHLIVKEQPSVEPPLLSVSDLARDFEEWWSASGRVGSRADAWGLYRWWRTQGAAGRDELLTAIANYRCHCGATNCLQQHGRTFLVKPTKTQAARWPEWASGEAHGSSDVAGGARLSDVLQVGLDWIGGNNDDGRTVDGGEDALGIGAGRRDSDSAVGEDAGGCLPQISLASGE